MITVVIVFALLAALGGALGGYALARRPLDELASRVHELVELHRADTALVEEVRQRGYELDEKFPFVEDVLQRGYDLEQQFGALVHEAARQGIVLNQGAPS